MNLFEFSPVLPSLFLTCLLQVTLLSVIVAPLYLDRSPIQLQCWSSNRDCRLGGCAAVNSHGGQPVASLGPKQPVRKNWFHNSNHTGRGVGRELVDVAERVHLHCRENRSRHCLKWKSESPLLAGWNAFVESLGTVANEPVQIVAANEASFDWTSMILLLLVLGIAFCLLRMILALISVHKLVKTSVAIDNDALHSQFESFKQQASVSKSIALRQSAQVPTPATVGWWSPTILLPADWSTWSKPETDAVLAHELAHVASGDYLSWVVARFAVAFHFYHPVVRWLATRLQLEQELAADEAAANLLGNRKQYLHSLASLALATPAHQMTGPARTLIPQQSLLTKRVEMLRTSKPHGSSKAPFVRLTAFAMTALAAIAIAGFFKPVIGQQVAESEETPAALPATVAQAKASAQAKVERIPLTLVPKSASGVLSVRPKELLSREAFRRLCRTAQPRTEYQVCVGGIRHFARRCARSYVYRGFIQFDPMRDSI